MATVLDAVTSLQGFSIIFVFLFVMLFVYAILLYTRIIGHNQVIIALVAFVVAIFVLLSPLATLVVKSIAPWFAVVLVLLAIVSVAGGMFGHGLHADSFPQLKAIVMVVLLLILVVSSLTIIRDNIDVPERGEDFEETSTIIFHPNFIGLILIFLIAVFTVGLLAARQM